MAGGQQDVVGRTRRQEEISERQNGDRGRYY